MEKIPMMAAVTRRRSGRGGRRRQLMRLPVIFNSIDPKKCDKGTDCLFEHRKFTKNDKAYLDGYFKSKAGKLPFDAKKLRTMASTCGLDLDSYDCFDLSANDTAPTKSYKELLAEIAELKAAVAQQADTVALQVAAEPSTESTPSAPALEPFGTTTGDAFATVNVLRSLGLSDEQSNLVALVGLEDRQPMVTKFLNEAGMMATGSGQTGD